ncbi:hypothetical protein I4L69_001635 [Enterococcus faecium]|nr:hypothetical protein [Enterococcus faecium]
MNYELIGTVVVLVVAVALFVIRFVKGRKNGTTSGNTALDVMTIVLPLISEAIEKVNEAKADGKVTRAEMIDLVTNQTHMLIQESPLTEAEKALITEDLLRIFIVRLLDQLLIEEK